MQTYRYGWIVATRVVVVTGTVALVVSWAVADPWSLAIALAAGWLARCVARRAWPADGGRAAVKQMLETPMEDTVSRRLVIALPTFFVATLGWSLLLGGGGVLLVLLDALIGWPLLLSDDDYEARVQFGPDHETLPIMADQILASPDGSAALTTAKAVSSGRCTQLSSLSDAELWHAWQESGRALQDHPDAAGRLRIVAARAIYLDALAERDPAALDWLLGVDGP